MAAHQGDAIHVEGLGSFDWMVVDAGIVNYSIGKFISGTTTCTTI